MKVARALSETLRALGTEIIFGNPGTTELPFLEEVQQRYVLTLHDGIALGAADGFAQVERRPSVANLHGAPGLGNAMGFLDSAWRNRSPVVVTVGQQDLRHLHLDPLLFGNFQAWAQGRVKWTYEATSREDAVLGLTRAYRTAALPPWGPVLVSLPMNVMEETFEGSLPRPSTDVPSSPRDVSEAVRLLAPPARPAIVAGYEVDAALAFDELELVATKLGCPIFAEPLASRSPARSAHANFAGDLLPASALISQVLGDYDPILLVGADLTVYPYTPSPLLAGKTVIYLGQDPQVASRFGHHPIVGDLRATLRALGERLPQAATPFRRPRDFARANRVARAQAQMGGEFVLDAVNRTFTDHTIVDEAVSHTPLLKGLGFYRGPDSYFASRSGQLGWSLSASIGIGLRREKTLVVLGDGALLYAVQALGTLAREKVPAKVLVLNNHSYAILRSYSKAYHPGLTDHRMLRPEGIDPVGLARAFGVPAESVAGAADVPAALEHLRDRPGPALLNVEVDPRVPDLFS